MNLQAVLTGDIANSTLLDPAKEKKLLDGIKDLFRRYKIEFFRGDSFQVYLKEPKEALRLALAGRAMAISLFKEEKKIQCDIRISIGLGNVQHPVRSLRNAKGEAFLLSGREFDRINNSDQRLAITVNDRLANLGLKLIADYLNTIFDGMTGKQADVIAGLLKGETQKAASDRLKKNKSTIHQLIISGHWSKIKDLIEYYEDFINQLS